MVAQPSPATYPKQLGQRYKLQLRHGSDSKFKWRSYGKKRSYTQEEAEQYIAGQEVAIAQICPGCEIRGLPVDSRGRVTGPEKIFYPRGTLTL